MKTRNELLVLAGLMLAWAGVASAELTLSWTGERQGVARASVAEESEPTAAKDTEEAEGADEETAPVTREEYLASVAWVEGEVAVDELSRRMVDGLFGPSDDGEESQYGESTLPGGGDDAVLPGGMKVTRGAAGNGGAVAVGGGEFSAADSAGNYTGETDWADKNGGSGFGAWQENLSGGVSVERTVSDGSFKMQAGEHSGEIAMVRPLETSQGLESGEFSVTMWGAIGGADEPVDFAGFAVYGSGNGDSEFSELFRWGFSHDKNDGTEGIVFSMDMGDNYTTVCEGGFPMGGVDYIVTWALVGGNTQFTLSVVLAGDAEKETSERTYYFNGEDTPYSLGTSEEVMAIAAILTESGSFSADGDGSEMEFDNMKVTGTERAVPEPGVLGLLAAGLATLWGRRTKREK